MIIYMKTFTMALLVINIFMVFFLLNSNNRNSYRKLYLLLLISLVEIFDILSKSIEFTDVKINVNSILVTTFILSLIKKIDKQRVNIVIVKSILLLNLVSVVSELIFEKLNKNIIIYEDIIMFISMTTVIFLLRNISKKIYLIMTATYILIGQVSIYLLNSGVGIYLYNFNNMAMSAVICYILYKNYILKEYNKGSIIIGKNNRLNILLKMYNCKLNYEKYENDKMENNIEENISSINKLFSDIGKEFFFIEETLSFIYKFDSKKEELCEKLLLQDFLNKEFCNDLSVLNNIYSVLYDGEERSLEINHYKKYYRYKFVLYELVKDKLGILIVKDDITCEKLLKKIDIEKSMRYKTALEKIPDSILLLREDEIVFQNKEYIYNESIMNDIILNDKVEGTIKNIFDDDNQKILTINKINLYNESEKLVIIKDITDEKKLMYNVKLLKKRHKNFINIVPEGLITFDIRNNKIKYTNKSFKDIVSKRKIDVDAMVNIIKTKIYNLDEGLDNFEFKKMKISSTDGQDVYLEFGYKIYADKHLIVVAFRDITKETKRQISMEIKKKHSELLKLKREFFININHELNTPLNLIKVSNELTQRKYIEHAKKEDNLINLLNEENKNIKSVIDLVENWVQIEKLQFDFFEDKRKYCNLVDISEDVVCEFNKYNDINIVFDTNEEDIFFMMDYENIYKTIKIILSILIKDNDKDKYIKFYIKKVGNKVNLDIKNKYIKLAYNDNIEQKSIDTKIKLCKLVLDLYKATLTFKNNYSSAIITFDLSEKEQENDINNKKIINLF